MTEEIDQIETQEETMTIDRTIIISREEKKIENMEDKTEDSMNTKKIEEIEVTVETIETERTKEGTTMATTDQGPEGLARGLHASGGLLQATPRP